MFLSMNNAVCSICIEAPELRVFSDTDPSLANIRLTGTVKGITVFTCRVSTENTF